MGRLARYLTLKA